MILFKIAFFWRKTNIFEFQGFNHSYYLFSLSSKCLRFVTKSLQTIISDLLRYKKISENALFLVGFFFFKGYVLRCEQEIWNLYVKVCET